MIFQAFEELEVLLSRNSICIAVKEKLVKDSGVASEAAYDTIVSHLQTKPRARGKNNSKLHTIHHLDIDNIVSNRLKINYIL